MPGNKVNTELFGTAVFQDLLMSCHLIATHPISLKISRLVMQQQIEEGCRETMGMVSIGGKSSVFNVFLFDHFMHVTIHLIPAPPPPPVQKLQRGWGRGIVEDKL